MGRLQDFDDDSVTCDRTGCGKHERVPSGQVPDRWLRGSLAATPGATYDACGGNCAVLIAKQVALDPKAEYCMRWWSSKGESAVTVVGPNKWSIVRE